MYHVIRPFASKNGHKYKIGDVFPHAKDGNATKARVKKLSTTNNKYNQIYIEKSDEQ